MFGFFEPKPGPAHSAGPLSLPPWGSPNIAAEQGDLEAQEIMSELGGGMRGAWLDSFEFKEFEELFENYPDTLRPFGWRWI